MPLQKKYQRLQDLIKGYGSVAVAFSGGVDSTLLLRVAVDTLGPEKILAITSCSPLFPAAESAECRLLATQLGVQHRLLETEQLEPPELVANGPQRCYHCKKHLFLQLLAVQHTAGADILLDGSNLDDLADYRPGRRALEELKICSPLLECEFTKNDVRALSRQLRLETGDKPAMACLASRVPYGTELSSDLLSRIGNCEHWLHLQGFAQARVRCHDRLARIEIAPELFARLTEPKRQQELLDYFKKNEFDYITLDLQGYRRGSMNETLTEAEKEPL